MKIDAAEIPLRAGFTSKERDTETGLDYGVYPALAGVRATTIEDSLRRTVGASKIPRFAGGSG